MGGQDALAAAASIARGCWGIGFDVTRCLSRQTADAAKFAVAWGRRSPPPMFSPPRPGSSSSGVGGRRRGDRTEHAQLGGRTAEELAVSASSAPIRLSGFSQPQSAQSTGPAPQPAAGLTRLWNQHQEGPGPSGCALHLDPLLRSPSRQPRRNLTCSHHRDGNRGEGAILSGKPANPPAGAPCLLQVDTQMLGHQL